MGVRYATKLRGLAATAALVAALAVLGGCAAQTAMLEPALEPAAVSITQGAFTPAAVTIPAGTMVVWNNNSTSVQSINATAFRSGTIPPGGAFSNTFATAGTFRYTAGQGPTPVGTVVVTP